MAEKMTMFEYGFNLKGKRKFDVGEDLIGTFKAPESWEYPVYSGTPVDYDSSNAGFLKKTADGALPEALLFSRVSNELRDIEMYESIVARDEVRLGENVAVLPFKKGAIIRTGLLADGYTPTAGDDIYIDGGKFSNTDQTAGSGVVVAKVIEVDVNGKVQLVLK